MNIYLIFNKEGQKNLVLNLPEIGLEEKVDLYYFALDTFYLKGNESLRKIILNISALLKIWIEKIDKLSVNEDVLLPFDYSDQYLGCLKVTLTQEYVLLVEYGFTTKYTGAGIYPSQFRTIELDTNEFTITTINFNVSKDVFIKEILASIDSLIPFIGTEEN